MILTFESGLKNHDKWISITNDQELLLRKASIKSMLNFICSGEIKADIDFDVSVSWAFDRQGARNGYKLTIVVSDGKTEFEVSPTTKYPFMEARVFKTMEAVQNFAISLGIESFRVDMG